MRVDIFAVFLIKQKPVDGVETQRGGVPQRGNQGWVIKSRGSSTIGELVNTRITLQIGRY